MGYKVAENYSPLNCYEYNKNATLKTIDWLSSPARYVLGGNINTLAHTNEEPGSVIGRIAALCISILIAPIAIISTAALLLKLASLPWYWEKPEVIAQSENTENLITAFKTACSNTQMKAAAEIVDRQPEIMTREDTRKDLYSCLVNTMAHFQHYTKEYPKKRDGLIAVISLTHFVPDQCIIARVNSAVERLLWLDYEEGHSTSAKEVIDVVTRCLGSKSTTQNLEECYHHLIGNALKLRSMSYSIDNAIHLDIADALISDIAERKVREAKDPLQAQLARNEVITKKSDEIFENKLVKDQFYVLYNSTIYMPQLHEAMTQLRGAEKMVRAGEDLAVSLRKPTSIENWNDVRKKFDVYKETIDSLRTSERLNKKVQEYLQGSMHCLVG